MHVFLTGAGGYSGGTVLRALHAAGHRVTALAGTSTGRVLALDGVDLVRGDLAGDAPLPKAIDCIVHLAARSPYHGLPASQLIRENVLGTQRLVSHALNQGVRRIVFASSVSVYGEVATAEIDEATPIVNPNPYGMSKRLCEIILAETGERLSSMSLRLPGLVGPGLNASWLAGVLRNARAGIEISFANPDAPFNNVVHIEDLAAFIAALLGQEWSGHRLLTLGTLDAKPVADVVETIVSLSRSASPRRLSQRPMRPFTISSRRARDEFRYQPKPIAEVLRQFVRENP